MRSLSDSDGMSLLTVDGKLHVLQADPEVLFSRELIEEMRGQADDRYDLDGDLLKIYGVNATVIYRLAPKGDLYYLGRWPD